VAGSGERPGARHKRFVGGVFVNERSPGVRTERLRQLSEEVSRLAATLTRLAMAAGEAQSGADPGADPGADATQPEIAGEAISSVIRARRRREHHLPRDIFADPAWDMMLDLLEAEVRQRRVTVSSLCIAAAVPSTTALRWLKTLVDRGLLIRRADPTDLRRVYIELSPATSIALRRYFAQLEAHAGASPWAWR
jgi:hypothetical protein